MELCTARGISSFPHHHTHLPSSSIQLRRKPFLPLKHFSITRNSQGLQLHRNSSIRSMDSEESNSGSSQYVKGERNGIITTVKDVYTVEENKYTATMKDDLPVEDSSVESQPDEDSSVENAAPLFDVLDKLDVKLKSEDTYSLLLFGGGALVALWLATAVVSAIDSIPVFPKLLEVVGLSYTLWFSTRYLIFKKNRDELVAKIEEVKQQVLGTGDDD